MSERKVLNKYYPPDFDPSRVPKLRLQRERQYTVRTMAPFNMRCNTCGDYIYQGKKFNAKTENVQDETYIGLRIYRFYIRCPKCISEISFKTDPENEDYTLEHGATRLFEAAKMLRKAAEQEKQDREEEEANNPMKVLENRTKDSKLEMEIIENLEELRELNTRKADIDYAEILRRKEEASQEMMRKQEEEDEEFVRQLFGKQEGGIIKRLDDEETEDGDDSSRPSSSLMSSSLKRPSDVLISDDDPLSKKVKAQASTKSKFSSRSALAGLVKVKKPASEAVRSPAVQSASGNSASCPPSGSESTSRVPPSGVRTEDSPTIRTDTVNRTQLPVETNTQPTSSLTAEPVAASSPQGNSHQGDDITEADSGAVIASSIREGLSKRLSSSSSTSAGAKPKAKSVGLSLLGGYAVSDDSNESDDSTE